MGNVPAFRHCELLLLALVGMSSRDSVGRGVSCRCLSLLTVVMFVNLRGSGMCVGDVLAVGVGKLGFGCWQSQPTTLRYYPPQHIPSRPTACSLEPWGEMAVGELILD